MFETLDITQALITVAFVGGGFFIGLLIQLFVSGKIKNLTENTSNPYDDDLVHSIHYYPEVLFTLTGAYLATNFLSLENSFLDSVRNIISILIIISATALISSMGSVLLKFFVSRNRALAGNTTIFSNVLKILIYAIGILVALQTAGIDITALIATLGVGGIAVALALQDTLSNLFAGIYLIAARKIKPGDYIELETGEKGYVEDISWRNTQIRALGDSHMIIVPNSNLSAAVVKNYYLPIREISVIVQCGVAYNSDLDKVEEITIDEATKIQQQTDGAVKDFSPFVRFNEFGDSSINFDVILRGTEYVDQFLVKHLFIKALHKRFEKEGIEIPFPQTVVEIKK